MNGNLLLVILYSSTSCKGLIVFIFLLLFVIFIDSDAKQSSRIVLGFASSILAILSMYFVSMIFEGCISIKNYEEILETLRLHTSEVGLVEVLR